MPYTTTTGGLNFQYPTRGTRTWSSTLETTWALISSHNHTGAPNGSKLSANAMNFTFTTWSPVLVPAGSMTAAVQTVVIARYLQLGKLVLVTFRISPMTLGGSASDIIRVNLPATASAAHSGGGSCVYYNATAAEAGQIYIDSTTTALMQRTGGANFTLAASQSIQATFFYEAA